MRALVVYESMWGNTEQVARAVARGLDGSAAGDVTVAEVHEPAATDVESFDLLVVGGPTHAFSMSRTTTRQDAHQRGATRGATDMGIREWLEGLPSTLDVAIATFDTRVEKVAKLPGSAAKGAAKELRRHHHGRVVARESFYVDDMAGPLTDGELARAETWGRQLATVPVG